MRVVAATSVFARAFLDELESNRGILSSPELFSRIRKRVEVAAQKNKLVQVPRVRVDQGRRARSGRLLLRTPRWSRR